MSANPAVKRDALRAPLNLTLTLRKGELEMNPHEEENKWFDDLSSIERARFKREYLGCRIDSLSSQVNSSRELTEGAIENIRELKLKVGQLEEQLKAQRQEEKRWFIIPLILVIGFVSFLVYKGLANSPDVSINFDVGEIIGGSLAGLGALIAGVTYAYRRTKHLE